MLVVSDTSPILGLLAINLLELLHEQFGAVFISNRFCQQILKQAGESE